VTCEEGWEIIAYMCVRTRVCEEPIHPRLPELREGRGGVRMGAASPDYVKGIIKISL